MSIGVGGTTGVGASIGISYAQNYIGWDAQDSAWDQKWLAAVQATAAASARATPPRGYSVSWRKCSCERRVVQIW